MRLATPQQFFEALYQGVEAGFIEIRPLLDNSDPSKKSDAGASLERNARKFFDIRQNGAEKASEYCLRLGGLESKENRFHVYFGVGLRKSRKMGTKENVGSIAAAFADVDFKHVPKDEVLRRLKELPLRPSIIVTSGNGVHVYWLLKECLYQSKFPELEAINVGLLQACGAQVGTQDVSRILRVPETANIKAAYPDPKPITQIVRFEPDRRYDLKDFEPILEGMTPRENAPGSNMTRRREGARGSSPPQGAEAPLPPPAPSETTDPIDISSISIPEFTKRIIREGLPAYIEYRRSTDPPERFEARSKKGHLSRSEADSHVVIQLLSAGLSDIQIYSIYRDPQNRVGEKYRERRDGDKYLGVTIRNSRAFRAEHPRVSPNDAAERVGKGINRKFPDALIEIPRVVKINYQAPIYMVHSRLLETGEVVVTRCTEDELDGFKKFRKRFLVQNDKFPPFVTQQDWEGLVNMAKFEVQEVDEELASTDAEVGASLDDWLSQAQSEATEAVLQFLPVHDQETNQIYIRLKAFMQYLANEKVDAKKRDIVQVVKRKGFNLETKRFGKSVAKVWSRPSENGQAHQTQELF